jgi:hypothetical protein
MAAARLELHDRRAGAPRCGDVVGDEGSAAGQDDAIDWCWIWREPDLADSSISFHRRARWVGTECSNAPAPTLDDPSLAKERASYTPARATPGRLTAETSESLVAIYCLEHVPRGSRDIGHARECRKRVALRQQWAGPSSADTAPTGRPLGAKQVRDVRHGRVRESTRDHRIKRFPRDFMDSRGLSWTAVPRSSLSRNEGVPGSSPGVGFSIQAG